MAEQVVLLGDQDKIWTHAQGCPGNCRVCAKWYDHRMSMRNSCVKSSYDHVFIKYLPSPFIILILSSGLIHSVTSSAAQAYTKFKTEYFFEANCLLDSCVLQFPLLLLLGRKFNPWLCWGRPACLGAPVGSVCVDEALPWRGKDACVLGNVEMLSVK